MPPKKRPRPNATTMKMVGRQVAAARIAKNLTQRQLGELVNLDEETIASIEQGRRALMPNVAELMDFHLGLPGLLTVAANEMPDRDPSPPWSEAYMDLERTAITFSWFECTVIPGLLQTEGYMRALFASRVPAYSEETIGRLTGDRLDRMEILRREVPPSLSFVVWEPALRDRLGGNEVYKEQLRHLLACTRLPHVTFQVLPAGTSHHAGRGGSFTVLETAQHQYVAYTEGQRCSNIISGPDDVSILAQRYAMLRTQALNIDETRTLLDRLLGER
ncbi:Scr1 family TA system antitoxin-like transcriptional regulator [Streptomyces sp. NPDC060031]|uniref:helix-turn-helix domain-containing protein n=1 Tax=Streptomyces sp. NPDC060031 TaxID=3347043 RepID=UPI00367D5573